MLGGLALGTESNTLVVTESQEGDTIKLKVGRAVNLVKRIDQWGKQCGSKEQVLRGFYPGSVETDETSLMKGRVIAGEKGPWCHRLGMSAYRTDVTNSDFFLLSIRALDSYRTRRSCIILYSPCPVLAQCKG